MSFARSAIVARAGDGVDKGAERGSEDAHPLLLGAQLEQLLLGLGGQLDPRGDRVGVVVGELVGSGGSPADPADQLGERLLGRLG